MELRSRAHETLVTSFKLLCEADEALVTAHASLSGLRLGQRELAKAEQNLQATRERITQQHLLIEERRKNGHDATLSEQILLTLQLCQASHEKHLASLQRWHRQLNVD
jgi:hypothetical protein